MNLVVIVQPSRAKAKKYAAIFYDEHGNKYKTINFGDVRFEDFTQHKDPTRRDAYIRRRQNQEDWEDPFTAGFWSRHLLWEDTSILVAANKIMSKFGINVTVTKKRKD